MPQRTLKFLIRPDGRVEERVEGMTGEACHQLTEKLESALGSVEHQETTAEAYLRTQDQTHHIPAQLY